EPEAAALPAIVVIRLADGMTHFVVAWRRHGSWVQVMDPATGRRWPTVRQFLAEAYVHTQAVPVAGWREWAASADFLDLLRIRLRRLGADTESLIREALADEGWRGLAALDAAARMVDRLVAAGGL